MNTRPPNGSRRLARAVLAAALLLPGASLPVDELPSPDAMALGARVVPRALVEGFRAGLEDETFQRVVGGRIPAADQPALRLRAHAAMGPLLDEAFPPELMAGLGAQFLAAHYAPEELRSLRAREESPLGKKLRQFDATAAEIIADSPEARVRAREALARELFTPAEQRDIEAFAASPLGKKGLALAPDLAAFFVDAIDRRYRSLRGELDPGLEGAVRSVLPGTW
jgi:hypothetical protein